MGDRPWWLLAVQWGLWALAMLYGMRWMAKRRITDAAVVGPEVLAQPKSTRIIGIVSVIFFSLLAILASAFPGRDGGPWVSLAFLAFVGLGAIILLEYRNARHALTPDGLAYGKLLGARGTVRWSDVRRVRYAEAMKWFRLDLADGGVVRVSAMVTNLPAFAKAVLAGAGAEALDGKTREVLERTAAGDLPRIWG